MYLMRKNHAIALLATVFTIEYAISAAIAAPTSKKAYQLCSEEYNNCTTISGVRPDPYVEHGCDFSLKYGGVGGDPGMSSCPISLSIF